MEGKFPSKILVFVTAITHNCDSFSFWSQIFHILSSICEGFILPLQIRLFERAFWVRQKFLVANRHFSCSVIYNLYKSEAIWFLVDLIILLGIVTLKTLLFSMMSFIFRFFFFLDFHFLWCLNKMEKINYCKANINFKSHLILKKYLWW